MADELKPVDLGEHPEAALSANAEKGTAVGGVAGAVAGAIAGSPLGPAGAAIGAVIGGTVGAVGAGVVVAATDTHGEKRHSKAIQEQTDASIKRNEIEDDTPLSVSHAFVDDEEIP